MTTAEHIVITAAQRTPIGHFGGAFSSIPAPQLGAEAIKAVLTHAPDTKSFSIDQVNLGCVLTAGLGQAPARQSAALAGLPHSVPCTTVNKMCGSGMETILQCYDRLISGRGHIMIAGGMENMSRAPYLSPATRQGARLGHSTLLDHMMYDGLEDAYHNQQPMGYFADACAKEYNISREQQDQYTLASIQRATDATKRGDFKAECTPIEITQGRKTLTIDYDEGIDHAKPEKIALLKPAFQPDGTVTAANASNLSDGAAAVMMMTQQHAQAHALTPLATLQGVYTHAQAPEHFTTAPIEAIRGLLQQLNWDIDSVDCFEINEAFAVVPLVTMQQLSLPRDKVNVNGGACVLGHPIGASGTRIVVTLIHTLQQKQLQRGIATACIGGGEAIAIALERQP